MVDLKWFEGKRILITGHTGFKGAWLSNILVNNGAIVTGYALEPPTSPNLFEVCGLGERMDSEIGDIRDLQHLRRVFDRVRPEIVIHLAAQPIVRDSYKDPVYTYETNVMGTVNVCECVRTHICVRSFLNVTTDKVYENREWEWGYRETDPLDGYDPYSNSKSCSELVTHSYINSFFRELGIAVSTARAGNVIGGGDYANDRIMPDCMRAAAGERIITVRNPNSTRPYQHVLDPLFAYLWIVQKQYEDSRYSSFYNVGPDDEDCVTTGTLVDMVCRIWGDGLKWVDQSDGGPHEASFLKLDCSKLKKAFGWRPVWHIGEAVANTVEWYKAWYSGEDIVACMNRQIERFLEKTQTQKDGR